MRFTDLLQVLDNFPLLLQVRNGTRGRETANWTRVVLTANAHPLDLYTKITSEQRLALARRLAIVHVTRDDLSFRQRSWTEMVSSAEKFTGIPPPPTATSPFLAD